MATKQTGEAPSRRRQQSPFPVTTLPAISVRLESQTAPGLRTSNIAKCVVTYIVKPPTSSTLPKVIDDVLARPRHRHLAHSEGEEGALGHRLSELVNDYYLNLLDWSADNRLSRKWRDPPTDGAARRRSTITSAR